MQYLLPEPPIAGPALHEPAASPMPNEPESRVRSDEFMTAQPQLGGTLHEEAACWIPNEPAPRSKRATESQGRMDRVNKCRING